MITLLLRCRHCKHEMKYLPQKAGTITMARKRCVYCGKGIRVKDAIIKHF